MLTSQRWNNKSHHNLTLAVLLVVFVCQFFPNCLAVSFEYADGYHPLGNDTHHQHRSHDEHGNSDLHVLGSAHLIETQHDSELLLDPDKLAEHERLEHGIDEHEHSSHAHNFCHPPVEHGFVDHSLRSEPIASTLSQYQALSYAPPIPPPHV